MRGGLLLLAGAALLWLAVANWRRRDEARISLIEAAILQAGGAEPLPLTRLDRVLGRVNIVFTGCFGLLLGAAGLALLLGTR